ncbi:hypothetical protein D3C81_872650 [compost metagenome]
MSNRPPVMLAKYCLLLLCEVALSRVPMYFMASGVAAEAPPSTSNGVHWPRAALVPNAIGLSAVPHCATPALLMNDGPRAFFNASRLMLPLAVSVTSYWL